MDQEPARESFILYAKWYTCISAFTAKAQGLAFKAICEYALFDIPIPKVGFSRLEYCTLLSFLPILDSNRERYENGKKGAVHGSKGGRPRKNQTLVGIPSKTPEGLLNETPTGIPSKTPVGLLNETPLGMSEHSPNANANPNSKKNADVDVIADVQVPAQTAAPTDIYKLLLPIFFFRNCNAPYEVQRFYKHYRLAEWRLSGGDLLDTPKKLITAAERWKVEDSTPFLPPAFIKIWRCVYEMAPPELKQAALEITSTSRMQNGITIVCDPELHRWLTTPETWSKVNEIIKTIVQHPYKLDVLPLKQKKP